MCLAYLAPCAAAKPVELKIEGDAQIGYTAVISGKDTVIARQGNGEFSAVFQNSDKSVKATVTGWRGTSVTNYGKSLKISGPLNITQCGARFDVSVFYTVINPNVLKKRISLTQISGPKLFYSLKNRLEPTGKPDSYWSFEKNESDGGAVYEVFPAAGFRTGNTVVGLLTDNGARNLWGRSTRHRDFSMARQIASNRQHDYELVRISDDDERAKSNGYVELNFGELKDFTSGDSSPIHLPEPAAWTSLNGGRASVDGGDLKISGPARQNDLAGMIIPLKLRQSFLYRLQFRYRSSSPVGVRLWDDRNSHDLCSYEQPMITDTGDGWKTIEQNFFLYSLTRPEESAHLLIGKDYTGNGDYDFQVKDLEFDEIIPTIESYHPLELGKPSEKTVFIFSQYAPSHRDVQIACQTRLAEALGCRGSMADKIFFSTAQMLTWIAEPCDLTPHIVPSVNYQPDMYMRDAFWIVASMDDQEVSEAVWNKYAASLDDRGCVATLVTPYITPTTNLENDSNLFFIILAYVNRERYGTKIDIGAVQRALNFLRTNSVDSRYMCKAAGWFDTIWLDDKDMFAGNQGLYVNVLKCAKALGCNVTDTEIRKAEDAYRSLYDEKLGYVVFAENLRDIVSPTSLMGECISWWLWNEPILSSDAVIGTIEKLPVIHDCVPCVVKADGEFMSAEKDPAARHMAWTGGVYHNGGSWLLYEYMAYVAGLKHGWAPARQRMTLRLKAEFGMKLDEPVSHEWLPLTDKQSDWWPITRVYGWNCFVRIANQVANRSSSSYKP